MNKRFAMCVGNNYPGTSAELAGCVNDARDWAGLLAGLGYEVATVLEASWADAVETLTDLVKQARFGDRVVFTFSGHGTWLPDSGGDEADGRDEAMCMADFMEGGLLVDDDLHRVFGDLAYGASALVLSDSCHSGTVSRLATTGSLRAAQRPRFLPPTRVVADLPADRAAELERKVSAAPPRGTASLISGCGDLEYSYDASFRGRPNGAFTRAAIDAFRPGISLNSWHRAIRQALPSAWYPQSPQLTASNPYRRYTRAL